MREIGFLIIFLMTGISSNISDLSAQETRNEKIAFSMEPSLKLPEALSLAQQYIKEKNIDTSKHYLDNIRLILDSSWMKGKHWIISWSLSIPSDGGQIFIIIGMDKTILVTYGK